jgi:hypothetical protein
VCLCPSCAAAAAPPTPPWRVARLPDAPAPAQAAAARLDALENDNAAAEGGGGDDSDDYVLADDLEGARARA